MAINKKNTEKNNYILIIVALLFIISLILVFSYILQLNKKTSNFQYFEIKNMTVQSKNYDVVTNLAIESSVSGNEWLKNNQQSLQTVLKNIIYKTDMDQMSNSEKLTYLENSFIKETKKTFPQAQVKDVIITDFLIQDN